MKDVITTLIPRYGELKDVYKRQDLYSRQISNNKVNNFTTTLPAPQSDLANYLLKEMCIRDRASGINSMPTFHSLFKNKTGMTPSEFKKTQMDRCV